MNRRQVLSGVGAGSLFVLAGCGGGGDGEPTDTTEETPAPATSPPTTQPSTPTATATTEPPPSPTSTAPDIPALGDRIKYEPRHRMRIEATNYRGEGETAILTGRWIEGNYTYTVEYRNKVVQWVRVDGETDVFFETRCFAPDEFDGPVYDGELWGDPETTEAELGLYEAATPLRRDRVDGERMYVYEVDISAGGVEGPVEYWISALTGYPVSLQVDGLAVEYWDWGQVFEPISSPC